MSISYNESTQTVIYKSSMFKTYHFPASKFTPSQLDSIKNKQFCPGARA